MTDRVVKIADDLKKAVRGDVFGDIVHRAAYSTDASIYRIVPMCVVVPRDAADIVTVVKHAGSWGIPIAARGAGSGVAGESLCAGIILDTTRYMTQLSVGEDGAIASCQAGVVLDELNNLLAGFDRKIGPDPSSGNRATIGGCAANNATGAHWLQYGYFSDYVDSVEAVLADGSIVEFKNGVQPAVAPDDAAGSIANKCLETISTNQAVIKEALPQVRRNRCGYRIWDVCRQGTIDLAKMLAGSEGTLAIFTKITLRTVKLPAAKGLLQLEFESLEKMAAAVPIVVASGAAACELMDSKLISMAGKAMPEYWDIIPQDAAAVLLVEHIGADRDEVAEKIGRTDTLVGKLAAGRMAVLDEAKQKRLWKMRKDAVPLLDRQRSGRHPVAFIEDAAVPNERLGRYVAGLEKLAKKYDVEMAFYGHAGDSALHVRPFMNLGWPGETAKMQALAEESFELVRSLGGTVSGEHGVGLVRAGFLKRQYGRPYYQVLREIKKIFDPAGLLNPGKVLNEDGQAMVGNIKAVGTGSAGVLEGGVRLKDGELAEEIEQCSGCGLCRSREKELRMCPVFRATGDEIASPRAKATVLGFLAGGQAKKDLLRSADIEKLLALCLNCQMCKIQCPAGVDVSKIVMAARAKIAKRRGLRRGQLLLTHNRFLIAMGCRLAVIANAVTGRKSFRWVLEKAAGLDGRRSLPKFGKGAFLPAGRKYLAKCGPVERPIDKVAYFVDTYANYNDPAIGFAVLKVLRTNDIEVILPKQRPAPLPAIYYGDVRVAAKDLRYNIKYLAKAAREGFKIICSEPSAVLALCKEYRHFAAGDNAELVAGNTFELMEYLLGLFKQGKLKAVKHKPQGQFAYHLPCHLLAVGGGQATAKLLNGLCGAEVHQLNGGCCGLAGTFGMQKKNRQLSEKIAEGLKNALAEIKAKVVLTECSACAMQIEYLSDKKAVHPIKVLLDCYGR